MFKWIKRLVIIALILGAGAFVAVSAVNYYFPIEFEDLVERYAAENDLNPSLVFAVIHAESRFRPNAVSRANASGLMQLMEPTAVWLADMKGMADFDYSQIFDPAVNIRLGTFYLRRLLDQFDGDQTLALAAYNAGEGNVRQWLANPEFSLDGQTLAVVPFPETETYLRRVAFNIHVYTILRQGSLRNNFR